ncbi:hypothetical protein B0H11DRAFT_1724567 [Mycena galericulata]|nr:hypothetical protein B0H11DRAFT_1724567 [Mycena galericulata]
MPAERSQLSGHYCPCCSKGFNSITHVRQHLNQPHGRCHPALHPSVLRAGKTLSEKYGLVGASQPSSPGLYPQQDGDVDFGNVNFGDVDLGDHVSDSNPGFANSPPNSPQPHSEGPQPDSPMEGPKCEYFPGASRTYGRGKTFMDKFRSNEFAAERETNPYFPFASGEEWEYASFLSFSNLSQAAIDELLKLRLVPKMNLSFHTAKDLRSRVEILPKGPEWKATPWSTLHPTKKPLTLYYRDPIECLQSLLGNPLIQDFVHFTPFRLWSNSAKLMRVYTEWLSGDVSWEIQEQLPSGATVLGTILSSDKTQLTSMTGNRSAYPMLISMADLDMDFRMKACHHAFLLLALLPIPKFREKDAEIRGVLANRLFHAVLDFILAPLKKCAEIGLMMTDPLGWRSITLDQLTELEKTLDPWDLPTYIKSAKAKGLNGVHRPFWRNWPLAEPCDFLTPEILHHWLKMFYDHLVKWCLAAVGSAEIDFRFAVLRPHTGMRHFREGISKAKQTTGREHRDIMRYVVPIIAEARGVTKEFLTAITSLVDFFYHGQAPKISEDILTKMDACLGRFHDHKQAILDAGARRGKKGPIENWYVFDVFFCFRSNLSNRHIPKLEFLQSVVPAIRANGVPLQWSADVTEHAHITLVKDPASNSNHQSYEAQICRHLDRRQKCRQFDLATAMETAGVGFIAPELQPDDNELSFVEGTVDLLDQIEPVTKLGGTGRVAVNYFTESSLLEGGKFPHAPIPYRTFTDSNNTTGFHLNRDHVGRQMDVDAAGTKFRIPDLRPALATYIHRQSGPKLVIGGRRPAIRNDTLPFEKLEIWHNLRIQLRSFHDTDKILIPETVNAAPPDTTWKVGRADAVMINTDSEYKWPSSGLAGHAVCQLRMILRVVPRRDRLPPAGTSGFLAYVQRFDIVPQMNGSGERGTFPEQATGMYLLKRARRADGSIMGDIVPLDRLRAPVELTPRFGKVAERRYSMETSLDFCEEFWLCKWFNKELFFALS